MRSQAVTCRPSPARIHKELPMTTIPYRTALIVGAGPGISASVARGLAAAGLKVGVAARDIEKLGPLAAEIAAERFAVDASSPVAVAHLFEEVSTLGSEPPMSCCTTPARGRTAPSPNSIRKPCARPSKYPFGGFLVVQQAARRMIPHGGGA